ncbi:oligosaccharide flippase family protein [Priestia aryabhattai]|uniref:oligosaccharide flippase family protein n=1 Tax=Priestia megaterium TaxID=1404 RepID=UPI0039B90DFA
MRVGFLHLLSANIIVQIAGFGGQLFLTRIISVEDIAIVRVLQSYYSILIIAATFGINMSIMKICSEDIEQNIKKLIFSFGFYISILINVVVMGIFICVVQGGFFTAGNGDLEKYLLLYNLQVPFFVLTSIIFAYYHAQNKVKVVSNFQSATKLSVIIFSILLALVWGLQGYIYGSVLCNGIAFFVLFLYVRKELVPISIKKFHQIDFKTFFSTGTYSFGTNILWQLLLYLNIIMANYMVDDREAIAFYGMAHLIINTMMMIPMTLNQIMIPYISKEAKNHKQVSVILKSYQRKMLLLILPLCLITYFLLPPILPYLLGEEYVNSGIYFKIMLAMLFCWSLFSPKMNTLLAVGKIKYNFYTYCFSIVIYVILNVILMLQYNMLGAAVAISLTFFITMFINQLYYLKYKKQLNY